MRPLCCLLLTTLVGCASWSGRPDPLPPPEPRAAVRPRAPRPPEVMPWESRLTGQLLDRSGSGLVGARVSVLPRGTTWDVLTGPPVTTAETRADGGFETGALPPGEYTVSAYTAAGEALVGGPFEVEARTSAPYLLLSLEQTPLVLEGRVVDEAGQPVADAEVRLCALDTLPGVVPLGRTREDGRYRVRAPRGEYSLMVTAAGFVPEMKAVVPVEGALGLDVKLTRPSGAAARQAALEGLEGAVVPLVALEAGHGLADLAPWEKTLEGARVVALGEATRGSHELLLVRQRMLELLVERLGHTALVIDAGFTETLALDEYVRTGEGDPVRALQELDAWTWNTEEMLGVVEWMRRYNENPAHARKLSLHGVDMPTTRVTLVAVLNYLEGVDAPRLPEYAERLAPLESLDVPEEGARPALLTALDGLGTLLETRRKDYEGGGDEGAWALARQQVVLLRQFVESGRGRRWRERARADNVRWWLQREGPEARVVVWASDAHVSRGEDAEVGTRMGGYLAQALGPALYVLGLPFTQGTFLAFNDAGTPQESRRGVVSFSLPPAPADTLEGLLSAVGTPPFAVDLRAVPRTGPGAEWWTRPQWTRGIGAKFSGGGDSSLHPVRGARGL